ncbi:MAG: hypothetical protein HZY76_08000 [Anaerolineae bacterium]|nr:MAG: hypothetical protein HZY76_08000 [Anaerolineae bacterium]
MMIDQAQTPPTTQAEAEIAAYRAQLSAAYQALEQAYAQIDTLQADQSLPADASSWDDHEGEDSDHDGGDHKRDHEDSDHDHDDHDDHARPRGRP